MAKQPKTTELDKHIKLVMLNLQERNHKWQELRERVRYALSGVLLENYNDRQTPHGLQSLDLIAALSSLDKHQEDVRNFTVDSIGDPSDNVLLDTLYQHHQTERAAFISRNPDMARLVIHDALQDVLTDGELSTDTVYRYSTYTLSELLPKFWYDIWTYVGNRAWSLFCAERVSESSVLEPSYLVRYLSQALAEYFAKRGLEKALSIVDINGIDDIMFYVAVTDDEQSRVARRVSLFDPKTNGASDVTHSIGELAYRQVDDALTDPNVFADPDDWQILNLLRQPTSKNVLPNVNEILNIRTVHEKAARPQHIDMQFICAEETLFRDIPEIDQIGFGVVIREQVLGMRDLSDRERSELVAAFHEVAALPKPRLPEPCPVPARGKRKKAMSVEDERQDLIEKLLNAKQIRRCRAERLPLDELRKRWDDYKNNSFDCDEEDED